jgi:hypothetical protein
VVGFDFLESAEKLNAEASRERVRRERVREVRSMGASIGIRRGESQKVTKALRDPLGAKKSIIHIG